MLCQLLKFTLPLLHIEYSLVWLNRSKWLVDPFTLADFGLEFNVHIHVHGGVCLVKRENQEIAKNHKTTMCEEYICIY